LAHDLSDVTVVADAATVSAANQRAIETAGVSFILAARVPDVPYVVNRWRKAHRGEEFPDGHVFTQPWPAGPADKRRDQVIYYQYRAVAGKAAVKRNGSSSSPVGPAA
jgi:hypothetical protein